MQAPLFLSLIMVTVLVTTSCSPGESHSAPTASATGLTAAQKQKIGRKIWQNESNGTVEGLTMWNEGEEFPSLGIGHFIWYPPGFNGRFNETWPQFVSHARRKGVEMPAVAYEADCPWRTKAEFQREFRGEKMSSLRNWLANNISIQTDFIVTRSQGALGKILAAVPAGSRERIQANYRKVASTGNGTYALIDYVNFKGDGTKQSERYNGQGWGLLQVLEGMKDVPAGQPAAKEFAASAKRALDRRIANSPPGRGESRWRAGWHNRCNTYAQPL